MADPEAGLRAAWRVLRPGGRLLIAEMLPKGPDAGDHCHRIAIGQWMAWLAALEPAELCLLAPADEEWLLARLGKPEG
jgi:ubiquinone/menaquinone biosynthesis C-methylase UbiE